MSLGTEWNTHPPRSTTEFVVENYTIRPGNRSQYVIGKCLFLLSKILAPI